MRETSENARKHSCICVSFLRVSQRKQQKDSWRGGGGGGIKHTYKGDFDPASGEAEYIEKDCKK